MKNEPIMKTDRNFLCVLLLLGIVWSGAASAQGREPARVREYQKTYRTYPYSDPNPVPVMTVFYPYFRFDGFTSVPVEKEWKVVELSNEFISLEILPEIGGKIWDAVDRATGKSFIYSNPVVKFRDVGMRGPWTSGGLEFNVGIIGHTPNCSSPVDYSFRENEDGSASCFIGGLDLIARADWTVEIRLPSDAAAFSTRVFWNNGSGVSQPYYTWMNLGVRAGEKMRAVNPGTSFIGHDGVRSDWPIDEKTGKDLSIYRNNDFGSYKSYHVIGRLAEFFGAYYDDEDFGIASAAPSEAKRGRKIWLWGLSREGMIWEDLLTDPPGGQYVEIQTGRLFNQAAKSSAQTPFKQREFAPYSTEEWTEYWMPVRGIGGFDAASSDGAMNVVSDEESVTVKIFAARPIRDRLTLSAGGKPFAEEPVELETGAVFSKRFPLAQKPVTLSVSFASLFWSNDGADSLTRPLESKNAQDSGRLSDHWQTAKEKARSRLYAESDVEYRKCLELDSGFVPAYAGLAENAQRRGDDDQAREFARSALELDTYDGAANLTFGRASLRLGNYADAQEAFSVAAMDQGVRCAALIGLGQTHAAAGRFERALTAFENALVYNAKSPDALFGKLYALRRLGRSELHAELAQTILKENPLAHTARLELYFAQKMTADEILGAVQTELPHELFLERAVRYAALGDRDAAAATLRIGLGSNAVSRAEMLYHLAYYADDLAVLKEASEEPAGFCFPFRPESLDVFRWAAERDSGWKSRYYLAVLLAATGHEAEAEAALLDLGETPDSAIFYAFRGTLCKEKRRNDYARAIALDDSLSKIASLYVAEEENAGTPEKFLEAADRYRQKFPEDSRLALLYARALTKNGRRADALDFLEKTIFLPNEGNTSIRALYHELALEGALAAYRNGDFSAALAGIEKARRWPENLGSGKPYPNFCDERLEDWFESRCLVKLGEKDRAKEAAERVIAQNADDAIDPSRREARGPLLTALAMRFLGDADGGEKLLRGRIDADDSDERRRDLDFYLGKISIQETAPLAERMISAAE